MKAAKGDESKSDRLTITLGAGQRRLIEAIARMRRTSAATVIRWALDEYIAANAPKKRKRQGSKSD
jgi:hypothetical protein